MAGRMVCRRCSAIVAAVLWTALAAFSWDAVRAEETTAADVEPTTSSRFDGPAVAERSGLRTDCEESGFRSYTSYDSMVAYVRQLQAASTQMKLMSYGRTYEGRELLCAVFSRPAVTQPWEALVSGKPIVVLSAHVHGGERTYRESLLILLRELATPGTVANAWLDNLVVLVVPSINPDGFVRARRGNALGIDMNRDYMKLEQQSVVHLVGKIHHRWHPHLIVDGHNGGSPPYNVCYQSSSNAASDPALTEICDRGIFPAIDAALEREGYRSFFYMRGNRNRWTTGGHDARIARNYIGLINSIGILLESPSGQSRQAAILSGVITYKAILEYAARHPDEVMGVVNRARRETVEMGEAARQHVVHHRHAVDEVELLKDHSDPAPHLA
jgi:hypothetical protein